MKTIILTLIIFSLCVVALGIGVFFKRQPLQKRCSSEPDQRCACEDGGCDKGAGNS